MLSFSLPLFGVSGGPYTLYRRDQFLTWNGSDCVPVGRACCNLAAGYTVYNRAPHAPGDPGCNAAVPACEDRPVVGPNAKFQDASFDCSSSVGATVPCNPPPAGGGVLGPASGILYPVPSFGYIATLQLNNLACNDATNIFEDPPGFGVCGIAGGVTNVFSSQVDCSTFSCRCPHGLNVVFGPLYCQSFPGAPVLDPASYIHVWADEIGPPCPDSWPCPEGMMARATRRPSGLLVSGAPTVAGMTGAALLDKSKPATESRKSLPLCDFHGDELTAGQRTARGLNHTQRWVWCEHPDKPLGDVVCVCAGCGPECPGYTVSE